MILNMILLIDNYDSFVYNLAHYVEELGYQCIVARNDKVSICEIENKICPSHIIISPGPCTPSEAGISVEVVRLLGGKIPILGVCLGHQSIGKAFGATIEKAKKPLHGKAALIWHNGKSFFKGLKNPTSVARYHSLVISQSDFSNVLEITSRSIEGEIMSIQHKKLPIYGVQFHPESILTEHGKDILSQFLKIRTRNEHQVC